jgi:hypothetical protein
MRGMSWLPEEDLLAPPEGLCSTELGLFWLKGCTQHFILLLPLLTTITPTAHVQLVPHLTSVLRLACIVPWRALAVRVAVCSEQLRTVLHNQCGFAPNKRCSNRNSKPEFFLQTRPVLQALCPLMLYVTTNHKAAMIIHLTKSPAYLWSYVRIPAEKTFYCLHFQIR